MLCNIKEQILQMDGRVPRYTSYPTAPHFKAVEGGEAESCLQAIAANDALSLYFHVPFCPKLCWYCGCHTKITQRYAPVEDYVHLLLREIDMVHDRLQGRRRVVNIHFGGGSPSYLRANDFVLIMRHISQAFDIDVDADIAIEVDPRNVSESRIKAYAQSGVNRISLGVQDFDEKVLEGVNRAQPFELSLQAVQLCRQYGIEAINLDLIYGLPHQTPETMRRCVEQAMRLEPSRIALFGYAHVPWMKKHMRLIDEGALPDQSMRYDLFEAAKESLLAQGMVMIGIDHFAKPDDELVDAFVAGRLRRNFQGYTVDNAQHLLGFGASAIGKLGDSYIQNSPDMPIYKARILAGVLPIAKVCPISRHDRLRADIIERLMCDFNADVRAIAAYHGADASQFKPEFERLRFYEAKGFVSVDEGRIQVKPHAVLMVRMIAGIFDSYLNEKMDAPRHAQAV